MTTRSLLFARAITRVTVALAAASAFAQDAPPAQLEFVPKSGSGRVVVVVSGQSGSAAYATTARQIADAGFDVVLVDGNDFWIKDIRAAAAMIRGVITRAQAGPHAQAGPVGVVGYSLGGAAALTYAARMPDVVASVVVAYPLTAFIKEPADFVGKIRVPVLMLAGTADTYKDCCVIEKARQLAEVSRASSAPLLTLHEYDGVAHGFNLSTARRQDQAAGQDALERTIAQLKQALPAATQK